MKILCAKCMWIYSPDEKENQVCPNCKPEDKSKKIKEFKQKTERLTFDLSDFIDELPSKIKHLQKLEKFANNVYDMYDYGFIEDETFVDMTEQLFADTQTLFARD